MRILHFFAILTQNVKTLKFFEYAHLQYWLIKHYSKIYQKKKKKLIDFGKFVAFKCVPKEKPIFLVNGEIKQDIKKLK